MNQGFRTHPHNRTPRGDRATGRPGDRATGRPGDRTTDRATGRPGDRATGRLGDWATGRLGDSFLRIPGRGVSFSQSGLLNPLHERPGDSGSESGSARSPLFLQESQSRGRVRNAERKNFLKSVKGTRHGCGRRWTAPARHARPRASRPPRAPRPPRVRPPRARPAPAPRATYTRPAPRAPRARPARHVRPPRARPARHVRPPRAPRRPRVESRRVWAGAKP